ncbi:O-antigen ligase family protein [Denitromonas ohlonensis]|uniref:O-antigen ligase family protein n=2 Tax=Denitromonas TaxID=139331 RepID=A0A557RSF4_9RHOO|nr:O-antigen ligase family protein [Denitromonas ohlonensis]TVO68107.1 hypothetical protein FHP90_05905 [Denitromonas ohlonensis]TVO77988.1 hypothetical protein FHP89_05755 [Denitromonas ohlonensis]
MSDSATPTNNAIVAYKGSGSPSATMVGGARDLRPVGPTYVFLTLITAYVALQTLAVFASSGLLKALSYAAAFGIVLCLVTVAAYLPKRKTGKNLGFGIALALYYYGFVASAAMNLSVLDFGTAIKMMLVPLFLVVGAAFETQNKIDTWRRPSVRWMFGLMVVLPTLLWLWQLGTGKISFGGIGEVSIFANRNNAGLFAVTLIALLNVLRPEPLKNLFVYLAAGAAFGTLGVLLAVMAALLLGVGSGRRIVFLGGVAMVGAALLYFYPLDYGVFARINPVVTSIRLIVEDRIDIANVTYGELVRLLQTTDVSFIFRLKHWLNIWSTYTSAPFESLVFGLGVGASARLSEVGLIPHNDYLRVLVECGPVAFVGFVASIFLTIWHCGRRWESVPLIAVAIYFMTENLVDNFVAMAVFFFCSGVLARRASFRREDGPLVEAK